jgi:hypothetical protein
MVQIYLYSGSSTANTVSIGVLDLYGEEPINLTYSINNIRKLGTIQGNFSQNFSVPSTINNDTLFNDVWQISSDSLFDPRKKVLCHILVDGIPVLTEAVLQLASVTLNENKKPVYEISIIGSTPDLVTALGESVIGDINFSALNHTWSVSNITNSWTGSTAGPSLGYYYSVQDYAMNLTTADIMGLNPANPQYYNKGLAFTQIFPSTYAKTIWDYIFSGIGYTYTSTFLNSSAFTSVVHCFSNSTDFKNDPDYINSRTGTAKLLASNTASTSLGYYIPSGLTNSFVLDTGLQYFPAPFVIQNPTNAILGTFPLTYYSASTYQSLQVVCNITGRFIDYLGVYLTNQNHIAQFYGDPWVSVQLHRSTYNGGSIPIETLTNNLIIDSGVNNANPNWGTATYSFQPLNNEQSLTHYPAQPNELFIVAYRCYGIAYVAFGQSITGTTQQWFQFRGDSNVNFAPTNQIVGNQLLDYNSLIGGKKVKQLDYLKSIITMYNLTVVPDKDNPKNLLIEPTDDYYSTGATVTDWQLDNGKEIKETLLSEFQTKNIIFTHKADKDYLNDHYLKTTDRVYGDARITFDNDFLTSSDKRETIFSPTPYTFIDDVTSSSYTPACYLPVAKIFKLASNQTLERTEINLRIGYKKNLMLSGATNNSVWFMMDGVKYPFLPYFGQFDNPSFTSPSVSSSNSWRNINFDETEFMYSVPPQFNAPFSAQTQSLYDTYWRKTFDEITDKNSKLITCYVKLTPEQIAKMNFNDKIYISGITNESAGEYFRINSVNYIPTSNDTTKVELLKIKDVTVRPALKSYLKYLTSGVVQEGGNTGTGTSFIRGKANISLGDGGNTGGNNNMVLGNSSFVTSSYNTIVGNSNTVGASKYNSVVGNANNITNNSFNVTVNGSGNTIGESTYSSLVYGNANQIQDSNKFLTDIIPFSAVGTTGVTVSSIPTSTGNNLVFGNYNYVASGVSGTSIFGSYVTATTSNTIYASKLNLNGTVFTGQSNNFCSTGIQTTGITTCSGTIKIGDGFGFNTITIQDPTYLNNSLVFANGIQTYLTTGSTSGVITLTGGSANVLTSMVTAKSMIWLTTQGGNVANIGTPYISTRSAGSFFRISSTNAADSSNVAWRIDEGI